MPLATAKWDPPGPGSWELNATNFPHASTRLYAEVLEQQFPAGFLEGSRRYGLLLDYLEYRFVNGFAYFRMRPAGTAIHAPRLPPKWLLKLLIKVHPELRRRVERSTQVFGCKLWREDVRLWIEVAKPTSLARHLALQRVEPFSLSATSLLAYLDQCVEHFKNMVLQRGRFTVPALLPTGDFLAHAKEWTGLAPSRLLQLLRGSTPRTEGAFHGFPQLVDAMRKNPAVKELLGSHQSAAKILSALCSLSGDFPAIIKLYLDSVGYLIVSGYDPGNPYALEMPDVLVRTLQSSINGKAIADSRAASIEEIRAIRDEVPTSQRALFDDLLADARSTQGLRDERGLCGDIWAAGLLRRAVLAVGTRLAESGRIHAPVHLVEASYEEIQSLARDEGGPQAAELAERARYRMRQRSTDAPVLLGSKPVAPPPLDWLPLDVARATRALLAVAEATFGEPQIKVPECDIRGVAVSYGTYEGVARLVLGPEDFGGVHHGDVLITESTSPGFNILLPLLGALVTDRGGMLSHAAIVAREYGIPAIVGTGNATTKIKDGARVRVDGTSGEVIVLS